MSHVNESTQALINAANRLAAVLTRDDIAVFGRLITDLLDAVDRLAPPGHVVTIDPFGVVASVGTDVVGDRARIDRVPYTVGDRVIVGDQHGVIDGVASFGPDGLASVRCFVVYTSGEVEWLPLDKVRPDPITGYLFTGLDVDGVAV